MGNEQDIRDLQEDRRLAAEAQVGRDYSDKLLKWIIGMMLSLLICGAGLYGKWITDSIHVHDTAIAHINQRETLRDENLDILNSKIDLILNHSNLEYNGPGYKHIESPDPQR